LLLVLAVDLPRMNAEFLRRLAADCLADCGVVPKSENRIEPLAAFYPKALQSLAETLLRAGCNGVAAFAGQCVQAGLARLVELPGQEARFFTNWNTPADFAAAVSS
jgi:molybdopterin-guanine dinucleotide biosynthesis protein A